MKNRTEKIANAKRPSAKPVVKVVAMGGGVFRIVNAAPAARWLGVSRQAFSRVIRSRVRNMDRPHTIYNDVVSKVKHGYPEIFSGDVVRVISEA